jgi:hypothetical protein
MAVVTAVVVAVAAATATPAALVASPLGGKYLPYHYAERKPASAPRCLMAQRLRHLFSPAVCDF